MVFFAGVCFGMLVAFFGQVILRNRGGSRSSDVGRDVADDESLRLARRRQREMENFLNYNGDRMPDPE